MPQKTTMTSTTTFEPVAQTLEEKEQFAFDVARQVIIFRQTLDQSNEFSGVEAERLTRRFQDAVMAYYGDDEGGEFL